MFSLDMRIFIMLLYFYIPCTTQNAVEVEKVEMTKNVLLLQASNTELNAKVDSLNKIIEANKKTKKELQVRNYLILLDHYLFHLVRILVASSYYAQVKKAHVVANLQQTCSNAVPTTSQLQDVFALLVPSLLTACYKAFELHKLVTSCSSKLLSFCNLKICE
jgi:hypothetical protein